MTHLNIQYVLLHFTQSVASAAIYHVTRQVHDDDADQIKSGPSCLFHPKATNQLLLLCSHCICQLNTVFLARATASCTCSI